MEEDKIVKRTFFDCLKNITNTKDESIMESDIKDPTFRSMFSTYMILRYLSMVSEYLNIIKDHQQAIQSMNPESVYRFLFKVIPQRRNPYIQYISKKKKA